MYFPVHIVKCHLWDGVVVWLCVVGKKRLDQAQAFEQ